MKRGSSTGEPNREEASRIIASKEGPCMVCIRWHLLGNMSRDDVVYGCDYHHTKSGNIRRGHMFGFANCAWHHRGHPLFGMDTRLTREKYGPSLADGSALFHRTYGSDDFLIEMQTDYLKRYA